VKKFYSIRTKLLAVITLTTFCALLVSGIAIFIYDINSFRDARESDMTTLIELLAYSTTPALQFRDEEIARENLRLLQVRPTVSIAAIYDAEGKVFASYFRMDEEPELPSMPAAEGVSVEGGHMLMYKRILFNEEMLGTVYLRADYQVQERAMSFVSILATVALIAMLITIIVSMRLQSIITKPVLSIAGIAREVVSRKEYTRRAKKMSEDEVGVLVDAFNDMLLEIETRTERLETTNQELELESAERKRAREEVLQLNEKLEQKVLELREKDRNKDDFLATLAHELRNPLAPIRTGLELIRKVDGAKRDEIYDILERQTHQLVRLVDDLMDVSRISRGKVSLQNEVVVLDEVLKVAIEATTDLMQQKNHHLRIMLPEAPVLLDGDPVRLSQVFLNLLSNAAHYTRPGGNIVLRGKRLNDMLEVSIEDNGIGMSPEMLDKVFEAFIQIETPLTRTRSGLGIGLTLARSLLEKHGGTIRAESEGLGKGTRFIVLLPLLTGQATPNPPAKPDMQPHDMHRILVVDDNEDAALTLAILLRMLGHDVKAVFDGSDALNEGRTFQPQIILMDLGMPGMNGIEAAKQIRQLEWGKSVFLVAVTGWGQEEDKRKTREAGFNHHLVKPIRLGDVQNLLAMYEEENSVTAGATN
jgi:signal transduction histidine kinase/CheY-like chemotaxis protein